LEVRIVTDSGNLSGDRNFPVLFVVNYCYIDTGCLSQMFLPLTCKCRRPILLTDEPVAGKVSIKWDS